MKLLKHWKILLAFVLVFSAGAVTGIVGTHLQFKRAFENGLKLEHWSAGVMDMLQKKLDLTPEQQPKVRIIVEDLGRKLGDAFGRTVKESGGLLVEAGHRMDEELNPQQRVIHQRMREEFRDSLKKHLDIDLPRE